MKHRLIEMRLCFQIKRTPCLSELPPQAARSPEGRPAARGPSLHLYAARDLHQMEPLHALGPGERPGAERPGSETQHVGLSGMKGLKQLEVPTL